MSTAWMLTVMLTAEAVAAPEPPPSGAELKAFYSLAIQSSARKKKPDPYAVVPTLVDLYEELGRNKTLSHAERGRLRRGVKSRLEELRDRVLREALRRERQRRRQAFRAARAGRSPNRSGLQGGGEAARAVELIELIQNTIAPESWDVNGGNGTIRYFSLLKVLVVRQTGEVHRQVGGALSKLK